MGVRAFLHFAAEFFITGQRSFGFCCAPYGYRDSIKIKECFIYIGLKEVCMNKLYEEIARVAFELYEKRGKAEGFHLSDWLEAERIVAARHEKKGESEQKSVKPAKRKTTAKKPKEEKATPARKGTPIKKTAGKKTSTTKKTT